MLDLVRRAPSVPSPVLGYVHPIFGPVFDTLPYAVSLALAVAQVLLRQAVGQLTECHDVTIALQQVFKTENDLTCRERTPAGLAVPEPRLSKPASVWVVPPQTNLVIVGPGEPDRPDRRGAPLRVLGWCWCGVPEEIRSYFPLLLCVYLRFEFRKPGF